MPSLAPLQIIICRQSDDEDFVRYEEAILRAFQGGRDAGGYLATGGDLGIQLEVFSTAPALAASTLLDSFCHTLTLVLVDSTLLGKAGEPLWDWLEGCWSHTDASADRHAMLVVPIDESVGHKFLAKRNTFRTLQLLQTHQLGEPAIRPAMLALRLLHECRMLLATALATSNDPSPGHLRIFISHAKMDGLPLAHALKHQIELLGWLEDFYDVDDVPAGSNWQRELAKAIGKSLIVILRTEAYDDRHWCQQEVFWADEYAIPAVVVDARTGLDHPAGILPLERIPTVRIPDGNLIRILFLALREGLRFLYFSRRVEQMKDDGELPSPVALRVFAFQPSMAALLRACQLLTASREPPSTPHLILYADPPLRAGPYEAAEALVAHYLPGARLVTPQTLAATMGATP